MDTCLMRLIQGDNPAILNLAPQKDTCTDIEKRTSAPKHNESLADQHRRQKWEIA